jgi:Tfp pilus assembly protein FimT
MTMVELVVVGLVAAILAIMAMAVYRPFAANVPAEADRVRNDLRLMQNAAMNWSTPLRFTPVGGGYSFSCPRTVASTPCSTGTLNATAAAAAGLATVSFSTDADSGISFSGSPGTLDYDNQGRPASSCDTTCSLRSTAYTATLTGDGTNVTVTVEPVTGMQR